MSHRNEQVRIMKIKSHIVLGSLEAMADKTGKGSLFRACIAFQRSCSSEEIGDKIVGLGYSYILGKDVIQQIDSICSENESSTGEFREAVRALRNAIEMASTRQT